MRSWVIGRGTSTPWSAKAIAVASGAPMKIGNDRSPAISWSSTTGVFDWRSTRTAVSRTSNMTRTYSGGSRPETVPAYPNTAASKDLGSAETASGSTTWIEGRLR